jgi:hypothetical protein
MHLSRLSGMLGGANVFSKLKSNVLERLPYVCFGLR